PRGRLMAIQSPATQRFGLATQPATYACGGIGLFGVDSVRLPPANGWCLTLRLHAAATAPWEPPARVWPLQTSIRKPTGSQARPFRLFSIRKPLSSSSPTVSFIFILFSLLSHFKYSSGRAFQVHLRIKRGKKKKGPRQEQRARPTIAFSSGSSGSHQRRGSDPS